MNNKLYTRAYYSFAFCPLCHYYPNLLKRKEHPDQRLLKNAASPTWPSFLCCSSFCFSRERDKMSCRPVFLLDRDLFCAGRGGEGWSSRARGIDAGHSASNGNSFVDPQARHVRCNTLVPGGLGRFKRTRRMIALPCKR